MALKEAWTKLKLKDIGINHVPSSMVQITFDKIPVQKLGQVLAPEDCQQPPHLYFRSDPEKLYTIICFDPDAPSRATAPQNKNWLHWIVVNVPGSNVDVGETTVTYVPPGPPFDSGLHRYVVLVFEQNKNIMWPRFDWLQKTHENRDNWCLVKFIDEWKKHWTGEEPIAAGCWRSEYDESVPELMAELRYNYETMPRKLLSLMN